MVFHIFLALQIFPVVCIFQVFGPIIVFRLCLVFRLSLDFTLDFTRVRWVEDQLISWLINRSKYPKYMLYHFW